MASHSISLLLPLSSSNSLFNSHNINNNNSCLIPSLSNNNSFLLKRQRSSFSACSSLRNPISAVAFSSITNNGTARNGTYTVGDFMTRKKDLYVVKTNTTVDEALEAMVEKKISGFPVVDDDGKLIGLVSDYDLLALNSIPGGSRTQPTTNLFPDADSSWKTFKEMRKLLTKNNGKVVGDLMTAAPLSVNETTNLEDAVRLLLDTKYHRLPVVDADGKLVGMIARENVVQAAVQIRRASLN